MLVSYLAQESRSLSFVAKTLEPYTLGSIHSNNFSGGGQEHVCREMGLEPYISLFLFPVLGLDPHFHVEVTKSREIQLECKSEGSFLQPKILWMDLQGGKNSSCVQVSSRTKVLCST